MNDPQIWTLIAVFVGLLYVVELTDTILDNRLDAAGVRRRHRGLIAAIARHRRAAGR